MPKRSWVSAGLALAATLALAGCAEDTGELPADASLTVYVSLPLSGPYASAGRDAADGARLALADAEAEAGGVAVRAEYLDDTEELPEGRRPTPARAGANARRATHDSTAIAFLGELTSGATRTSLPVTNEARLLQVSPGAGATDLVAPFPGTDELPDAQPGGERSFGRVIASDDDQARAAAAWAIELGWRRAAISRSGSAFAASLRNGFEAQAEELGLEIEPPRGDQADGIYLAGGDELLEPAGPIEDPPELISPRVPRIASDVLLPPYSQISDLAGGPLRATSAALDPAHLPAAADEFIARFREEYGRAPGRYAAYGYEAMAVILDSIDRAGDPADREAVIDAFLATEGRDSILGTYSIDDVGETTLDRLSGYRYERGRWIADAPLTVP